MKKLTDREENNGREAVERVLKRCFLFERSDLREITDDPEFTLMSYSSGETVYCRDEYERALGIIIKGKITVYKDSGGKRVIMRELGVADTFGAAALFGSGERYASVLRASGRETQIAFIPQSMMKRLMEKDFNVAERYIIFLSDRIRFLNMKLDLHTCRSASEKLLAYLEMKDDGCGVNMQRLSKELDMGRATLYRAVDKLCEEGIILKEDKRIVLIKNNNKKDEE